MTPAARLQTAIEILDVVLVSTRDNGPAADTIIADAFRQRRYAGSKDRRAVRELVYRAIRRFGRPPQSGRAAFAALARDDAALAPWFDGSPYGPAPLSAAEPHARGAAMPGWIAELIDGDDHDALLDRAPFDLRANTLRTSRDAVLAQLSDAEPIAGTDAGLRLPAAVPVAPDGLIEVQDAGSQMIVAACAIRPGMTVIDLCAGAGGKTLGLAAMLAGSGHLIACDTDRARLQRLGPRAARAGATVTTHLLDAGREDAVLGAMAASAGVVLVDAPCSGTGTMRRNPEARWRLTPDRLARVVALQAHILSLATPLVRPGGVLVYAVCSLIDAEGAGQAAAFLAANSGWRAEEPFAAGRPRGPGRMLSPAHDGTDGFFVARLRAPC